MASGASTLHFSAGKILGLVGDRIAMLSERVKAVDLFCGAGGLTHGLEAAGVDVIAGVDVDKNCQFPYEANNAARFIRQDLNTFSAEQLKELFGASKMRLLAGCAPCQPFSAHSKGRDTSADPKWPLLDRFADLVEDVRPELVTMENVARIQSHAVFERFVTLLLALNYDVKWKSLYCPHFGIAQERRRLVLLASRVNDVTLPAAELAVEKFVTVRDAIGNLKPIAAGAADCKDSLHTARSLSLTNLERIRASSPGGSWEDWPLHLRSACHTRPGGHSYKNVYGRMEWDKPAPTITTLYYNFGTGRFGHPEQDRALTLREGAILQSFPPDYQFTARGSTPKRSVIGRLIGNAVPPLLGKAIGSAVLQSIGATNGSD